MNLPNYFLADLPREATLSPTMLSEACQTLKRNRERYLAHRATNSLVNLLCDVARSWTDPNFAYRRLALEQSLSQSGFSKPTLERGLNAFFNELNPEAFHDLLQQDLGHPERLDRFCSAVGDQRGKRLARATGPEFLVHITAGNLPSPALMSIVLGVVLRSAQFVKCASGTALLPRLFAHSLYEADAKLGACIEVAEWRGGTEALESAVFEQASCVTATGSDKTLAAIRRRVPAHTRFISYGEKLSFAFIAADSVSGRYLRPTLERAADDVVAWNQMGCLSPHVFYVEEGGTVSPELFAESLAQVLDGREHAEPRGELTPQVAAAIASRRSIYELRAAHAPGTRLWCSKGSTDWTVVFEADPRFQLSCLNRFIYIKPARDLADALRNAEAVRGKVSAVGLAVAEQHVQAMANDLAVWGATRVCQLGRMQNPPLAWRHDGRLPLNELVTWTDLETL